MWLQHAIVMILLLAMPIAGLLEYRARRRNGPAVSKHRSYIVMTIMLWIITTATWVSGGIRSSFYFGAQPLPLAKSALWAALICAYFVVQTAMPFLLMVHKASRETMAAAYKERSHLLPIGFLEQRYYVLMAISIGVCEEFVFRSFLPSYLAALPFGLTAAAAFIMAAVLFGLTHFLQGLSGIIQSTIAGFLFTYLFYSTGSLLLPIALHILYDIRIAAIARLLNKKSLPTH